MILVKCRKKIVSLRYLHGRTDEKTKSSITLAGDLTEIRAEHIHETSTETHLCVSREGRIISEMCAFRNSNFK
jgi:hypothetical protein